MVLAETAILKPDTSGKAGAGLLTKLNGLPHFLSEIMQQSDV
jgi:hypothetical protein